MRLGNATLRPRQTKLIDPDHQLPPLVNRRRRPRSFEPIVGWLRGKDKLNYGKYKRQEKAKSKLVKQQRTLVAVAPPSADSKHGHVHNLARTDC
jgi:hypothetical protein